MVLDADSVVSEVFARHQRALSSPTANGSLTSLSSYGAVVLNHSLTADSFSFEIVSESKGDMAETVFHLLF